MGPLLREEETEDFAGVVWVWNHSCMWSSVCSPLTLLHSGCTSRAEVGNEAGYKALPEPWSLFTHYHWCSEKPQPPKADTPWKTWSAPRALCLQTLKH